MDPALGVITMFAADFAPQGWALCNGQLLQINQNQALFSILGTTYGGNGQTNFALPDFRGRSPMHAGQGPGLSNRTLGEKTGSVSVTLTTGNLPAHAHTSTLTLASTSNAANGDEPGGMIYATGGASHFATAAQANGSVGGASATLAATGGSQPLGIQQPYLAVTFIIALQGIFPSRN
ncbi:MAG: phage tail protein [Saprospiraceae bacterium]